MFAVRRSISPRKGGLLGQPQRSAAIACGKVCSYLVVCALGFFVGLCVSYLAQDALFEPSGAPKILREEHLEAATPEPQGPVVEPHGVVSFPFGAFALQRLLRLAQNSQTV